MSHQEQVNQYAERDASELDDAGGHYIRHVCAMTREKLHEKSDMAAEMAFRDMRIDALTKQRDELLASLKELLYSKAYPGLFAGVVAADNAAKLIKSIEDAKLTSADNFPYAAKMVPDGWQLVPVVATKAMWEAWDSAPCNNEDDAVNLEDAYSAMLAAAPKLGGE